MPSNQPFIVSSPKEYNLRDVKDRQYLLALYKKANKRGLDISKYNTLKQQIADVEYDLRRLHDPLYLRMSPNATNSYKTSSLHAKHFNRTKSHASELTVSEMADLASAETKAASRFGGLTGIFEAATKRFKK